MGSCSAPPPQQMGNTSPICCPLGATSCHRNHPTKKQRKRKANYMDYMISLAMAGLALVNRANSCAHCGHNFLHIWHAMLWPLWAASNPSPGKFGLEFICWTLLLAGTANPPALFSHLCAILCFVPALVKMFPPIAHLSAESMSLGNCQEIQDVPSRGLSWLAPCAMPPQLPAGTLCPKPGGAHVSPADVINDNLSILHRAE